MNRFSHRESTLLGYAPSPTSSSPQSITDRNSDVDFNDVFGGPPRRSSIHEVRYNGIEVNGPNDENLEDEFPSCPWPRALTMSEKPVFGEESSHRKRNPSDDFFDDIFSKDDSSSSTPRRGYERERDPFASSTPGSRGLSPSRPLPPRAEPFLSSSLPSQFREEMQREIQMKRVDETIERDRTMDGGASGCSISATTRGLPARVTNGMDFPTFGSPARTLQSKKNYNIDGGHYSPTRFQDSKQVYRQSPLSQEVATSYDNDASSKVTPEEIDEGTELKQELSDGNFQFHFSIYKWASKGVPFAMPLKQGKEKGRHETSLISKDQMPTVTPRKGSNSPSACSKSSATVSAKDDYKSSSQVYVYDILPRESEIVEEATLSKAQSSTSNALHESTKQIQVNNVVSVQSRNESSSASTNARGSTTKSQLRSLRFLLSERDDEGALRPAGDGEIRKGDGARQSKTQNPKKSTSVFNTGVNEKKRETKINVPDAVNVDKYIPQVAGNTSIMNPGKNALKGKVNEFVRMFNQDLSPKPKDFVISHSQDVTPNKSSSGEVNRMEEYLRQSDQEKVAEATEDPDISLNPSHEYSAVDITGPTIADTDQYLQINFTIKELAQEETNLLEIQDNNEEVKVIDAKIRQWSNGKEGNIRSLLSTLQHVLWPGSGWKTVPLVDIIEGSGVKRAYQRALLCLHPDKLQQKGAATHQKYTAERVFDILQEAWNQFNLLGGV